MVKYWLLDGEVLALDGTVLPSGWVISCLDMLPKKFYSVLGQINENDWFCGKNSSLSEVLSFWWIP